MDRLQAAIARLVAQSARDGDDPTQTFSHIRALAHAAADLPDAPAQPAPPPTPELVPRLTEPWFC
jgi:hypothetical protein